MADHTTTVWTCERCGAVEEVEGTGQPSNWVRAYFVNPPKASIANVAKKLGDLCDPCGGLLVDFVNGKNVEQEMARALEMAAIERWAKALDFDGTVES